MYILGEERDYIVQNEKEVKGFFGHYRWMSNFELCPVWYEGILYPSTEHAYQAAKTLDVEIRKQFLPLTCAKAKRKGQEIEIRENWESIKYDVMFAVVFDKFFRNEELRKKLIETESKYLEETNHWKDTFWGVYEGVGLNMLGKILMEVRRVIKNNPNIKIGFNL